MPLAATADGHRAWDGQEQADGLAELTKPARPVPAAARQVVIIY